MTLNGAETRWHIHSSQTPDVTPSGTVLGNWGSTTGMVSRQMYLTNQETAVSGYQLVTVSVPAGTTGVAVQGVSSPLTGPTSIFASAVTGGGSAYSRLLTGVFYCTSSATTNLGMVYGAWLWRPSTGAFTNLTASGTNSVQADGQTISVAGETHTVTMPNNTLPAVLVLPGDRMVIELGVLNNGSSAISCQVRIGNAAGNPDYAYSTGLGTGSVTPWFAINQDLYGRNSGVPNAQQFGVKAGGMAVNGGQ